MQHPPPSPAHRNAYNQSLAFDLRVPCFRFYYVGVTPPSHTLFRSLANPVEPTRRFVRCFDSSLALDAEPLNVASQAPHPLFILASAADLASSELLEQHPLRHGAHIPFVPRLPYSVYY